MYRWIVYLHIVSSFLFLLAHGVSVSMVFWMRREHKPERIRPVLDFSANATTTIGNAALMLIIVTGVVAGLMQGWWQQGWIWVSLGLLIAVAVAMYFMGTQHYHRVRKAVGLPYMENGKPQPAVKAAGENVIGSLVTARLPIITAFMGGLGLAIILWLMMFKPF